MDNILKSIIKNAISTPQKTSLILKGEEALTYQELANGICKAVGFLRKDEGLVKGDTIIIGPEKSKEFVFIYFASIAIGIVNVVCDPDSSCSKIEYIKKCTNPKRIFGKFKNTNDCSFFPTLDSFSINEDIDSNKLLELAENLSLSDICEIMFTTGTTDAPKGVKLSIGNISSSAANINSFIGNTSSDIEYLGLPLCHSFGLGRLRCVLSKGGTIILKGSFANLKNVFEDLVKYNVTGLAFVPAVWNYIAKIAPQKFADAAKNLKYIEIGSSAMSRDNKELLMKLLPDTRICMHYGLTEASRSAFIEFHSDTLNLDTIGRPSPNTEIQIINEDGKICGPGTSGEICVKGGMVSPGYLDMIDNANSYWGDFFRTGDIGEYTTEGYIKLIGRKKEMINVGGKKVAPGEVEDVLLNHDKVKDAACIGISDKNGIMGEVVKAFIVLADRNEDISRAEIMQFMKDKIELFKIPVEIEIVSSIPYTQNGKKQRGLLRK